jgi:hypothetical protein
LINVLSQDAVCSRHIWRCDENLVPLSEVPIGGHVADVAALVISRDRPDLTHKLLDLLESLDTKLSVDVYVVEMGSEKLSQAYAFRYDDPVYRGKPYGHNVALRLAKATGRYRYYWVMMNDVFPQGPDALDTMIEIMEQHPEIGWMAPTGDFGYLEARPKPGSVFHLVASTDYLSHLMRAEATEVAFLNPEFKYCWGVELEPCYLLHRAGFRIAYCDVVQETHWGTSTWGQVLGLPSRAEYISRAKSFIVPYYNQKYGLEWDDLFTEALPHDVIFNTNKLFRALYQGLAGEKTKPIRLHLYCGDEYLPGCINLDTHKHGRVDGIFPKMHDLQPFIKPGSASEIKIGPRGPKCKE